MGWLGDVRERVRALPHTFSLGDVYAFAGELGRGRQNLNVHAKIRQQLQELRERGEIRFLGGGQYEQLDPQSASDWPFDPGDTTTRSELCEILGLKSGGLNRKGMHKNALGKRFAKDLLIFHSAGSNPYGDRLLPGDRLVYVGEGQRGDQNLTRYNRYLAHHIEEGIRVHFFFQETSADPSLQYRGEFRLEEYRRVLRASEGRKVFEFHLSPIGK